MLKIGEFSRLAQVTVKTLRHYDRLGLLKPTWIDRYTGYRYYALEQLPRLNRILALKDLGFSLEQVKAMLQEDIPATELRGMLRLKHAELQQAVLGEQARLARIEARLRQIEHEGALPEYEVVLKRVDTQLVIGIRDKVPAYSGVAGLLDELCGYLRVREATSDGVCSPMAIYYDLEYREREIDVEVAVPIAQPIPATPRLVVHNLRGAPAMASVVHQGRYEVLAEAYGALTGWMQRNGYRGVGPGRELYLQGPSSAPDPARYVTEIQVPVEGAPADLNTREKENMMQVQIATKPEFTVVGVRYHGKNESDEIPALWDQFGPRMDEIQHRRPGWEAYGVCFTPDEQGRFEYVAGIDVEQVADVPQGMVARSVPAAKYAVFTCTLATIHEAYDYAFHTWLPKSGYEWGGTPDFERYDETFEPGNPESKMYIYVPIK